MAEASEFSPRALWAEGLSGTVRRGDVMRHGQRRIRVLKATQYMDLALIEYVEIVPWWKRLLRKK